ncbi:hypothetical protein AB0L59_29325 [Streptomyces sp. NPDC052109]|uniref:hypothetical protein n=1 Tax=Streptomyces sp. NPDC052109 TaxID=3155527 RepID=UPI0034246A68
MRRSGLWWNVCPCGSAPVRLPALTALTAAADELDPGLDPSEEAGRLAGLVDDPLNPAP